MAYRVDVHILTLPSQNAEWFDECLASLEGHPINVHVLDGVVGNVGAGRMAGFALGDAEYVSLVDPDDIVRPRSFAACVDALDQNPDAVMAYTREARIDSDGLVFAKFDRAWYAPHFGTAGEAFHAHHLSVFRRSALGDLSIMLDYPHMPEIALKKRLLASGRATFVDMLGYLWRQHPGQVSQQKLPDNPRVLALAKEWVKLKCQPRST